MPRSGLLLTAAALAGRAHAAGEECTDSQASSNCCAPWKVAEGWRFDNDDAFPGGQWTAEGSAARWDYPDEACGGQATNLKSTTATIDVVVTEDTPVTFFVTGTAVAQLESLQISSVPADSSLSSRAQLLRLRMA
ncbi:unnamed protein product [Prorocentrum cordatum]|uniref:Uncharacterized protein n=1 Tax=Prorocentrum cordatum TaxID=2364126 RepID=A0ABN9WGW1_9DINO|nr:unnamed protein product [Polarella glacialis]